VQASAAMEKVCKIKIDLLEVDLNFTFIFEKNKAIKIETTHLTS